MSPVLPAAAGDPDRQRASAAETARKNFTVYPRWIDECGVSRPFSEHPNYEVTRGILRSDCVEPDTVYPPWRDHYTFAIEVANLIGPRPSKHHRLERVASGQRFEPDTVLWWRRPWAGTRRAHHALRRRAAAGDVLSQFLFAESSTARHLSHEGRAKVNSAFVARGHRARAAEAAWQRAEAGGADPCDCLGIIVCDECALLARAGDELEGRGPKFREGGD